MTPAQKAEAVALYYDAKTEAHDHAGDLIASRGGERGGRVHRRLAHKLAVAYVACEMFVDETEVEAVLLAEWHDGRPRVSARLKAKAEKERCLDCARNGGECAKHNLD